MRPRSLLWAGGLVVLGTAVGVFALARAPQTPSSTTRTSPPVSAIAPATAVAAIPNATLATEESATPKPAPRVAARTAKRTTTPIASAPGSAGMIVGLDPETGELGMPTPEQLQELKLAEDPMNWSDEGLVVEVHPDGSKSIDVKGRFTEYSVVRMGPDGKLVFDCVQGAAAAKKLAEQPVDPNIDPVSGLEVR
jgi:hypothetical protein